MERAMTDETMRAELLPCPFCGFHWSGLRAIAKTAKGTAGGWHYFVRCPQCHATGPRSLASTADAADKWNTMHDIERARIAEIARSMGENEGPDYRRACDDIAERIEECE
jgi:hypothetical protein